LKASSYTVEVEVELKTYQARSKGNENLDPGLRQPYVRSSLKLVIAKKIFLEIFCA